MSKDGTSSQTDNGTRLILVSLSGFSMLSCLLVLVSMALDSRLPLVYGLKGASYAGPLTWIYRWLGLSHISPESRNVLYVLLMCIMFVSYFCAAVLLYRSNKVSLLLLVIVGFVVFSSVLLFIPPVHSRDVYSYAFHGRTMTKYNSNPYLLTPAAQETDVLYPLIGWKKNATVYGPLFCSVSAIVTWFAGDSPVANALGFKVLALIFYAGCLPLVFSLARRVSPGRETFALLLVAWNPMLLLTIVGGGHNDSMMAFFVLFGFLLYRRDRPVWGLVAVLLGATVKATALLALLPFLVYFIRDARSRPVMRILEAVSCCLFIPIALYLPYWKGMEILKPTRSIPGLYSTSSIPTMIKHSLFRLFSGLGTASDTALRAADLLTKGFFLLLFAAIAIALLIKVRDFKSMLTGAACITLLWVFTSTYVLPWYLCLAVLLAAAVGWNYTTGCAVLASFVTIFYRLPEPLGPYHPVARNVEVGPTLYLSVPLTCIFIAWLALQKPFSGLRSKTASENNSGLEAHRGN